MRYLLAILALWFTGCALARHPLLSPTGQSWPQASDLHGTIPNVPR